MIAKRDDPQLRPISPHLDCPYRACRAPTHPLRDAVLHALALLGLGVGGMAAVDSEDPPGIG